jgi:hypothetical protein
VLEWDEKREQEESENCPDQPPGTYDKAQEFLHRWATIWLLASLAEVTQRAAKSHIPCSFERIYSASLWLLPQDKLRTTSETEGAIVHHLPIGYGHR